MTRSVTLALATLKSNTPGPADRVPARRDRVAVALFRVSLSRISTAWDLLAQARGESAAAQHALLLRYDDAVHGHLLRAVCDPQGADDLSQEFAVGWLTRGFWAAGPARGRFRA